MKEYIVVLYGTGDGCDYTIGCNLQVVLGRARTIDSMENKVRRMIRSDYSDEVESYAIYETTGQYAGMTKAKNEDAFNLVRRM
jgi:hypothetical protein